MTMQVHSVLVRGDLQSMSETEFLGALGFSPAAQPVRNVPGTIVPQVVSRQLGEASECVELAALTQSQGWTLLSLHSEGALVDPKALLELSAHLGTRVIYMRTDDFGAELGVFDEGSTRRFASWEEGEDCIEVGEALGAEFDFESECPDAAELVELVDELGFELARANSHALYAVFALHAGEASLACAKQSEEASPDNLIQLSANWRQPLPSDLRYAT